jgi:peptidoglycan/LPS O-acetylase OafA/YrhL
MAETVRDSRRLGWLDGLRGLAAMQVVLLHYVYAFLPAIDMVYPLPNQDFWWRGLCTAPFVFLYDGHSAVYLFFVMSGVALTHAFSARPFAFLPTVMRRVIRLGLPMAAATIFAAALYSLLPDAHVAMAAQTGSPWLRGIGPGEISLASIAHQIAFEGLLAGFNGWSLLPGWVTSTLNLAQTTHGFDTPLWTLHIEFCGSLLVMLLVAVRASASRGAYRAICFILGFAFVLSPMVLFIIGHLVANHLRLTRSRKGQTALGAVFLGAGILLCSMRITVPVSMLWKVLPPPPLGIQGDDATLQKMIGAVLVFGGIAFLPVLRRGLERPAMRWLGKISFSLYLSHFPLLFTCVAACFAVLDGTLPYGATVAIAGVAGITASLTLAVAFERWIDHPAIMLSRMVGGPQKRVVRPVPVIEAA